MNQSNEGLVIVGSVFGLLLLFYAMRVILGFSPPPGTKKRKDDDNTSTNNVFGVIAVILIGIVCVGVWFQMPNSAQTTANGINGAWNNFIQGAVMPLVTILTQIVGLAIVVVLAFFVGRYFLGRRRWR
jgi:hypothetical protein